MEGRKHVVLRSWTNVSDEFSEITKICVPVYIEGLLHIYKIYNNVTHSINIYISSRIPHHKELISYTKGIIVGKSGEVNYNLHKLNVLYMSLPSALQSIIHTPHSSIHNFETQQQSHYY